jgi:hypothetical protein
MTHQYWDKTYIIPASFEIKSNHPVFEKKICSYWIYHKILENTLSFEEKILIKRIKLKSYA